MNEKRTVLLCMGGQKGGTGKSLLTTLFASYITDKTKYTVKVVDADDKQLSIDRKRKKEIQRGQVNTSAYEIGVYPSLTAGRQILNADFGVYDFIIIDFPGTLSQDGVEIAYKTVDLIFIPLQILSEAVVSSTAIFCGLLKNSIDKARIEADRPVAEKYFILNKVKRALKEYKNEELLAEIVDGTPYPCLKSMLPDWKMFESEWMTYPYIDLGDDKKRQKVIDGLCDEMFGHALNLYKKYND